MKWILVLMCSLFSFSAQASYEVIPLNYGFNEVDLDGDGKKETVIKTWRENFNAHRYSSYLFIGEELVETGKGKTRQPNIITYISPEQHLHRDMMRSSRNADCITMDYVLVKGRRGIELVRVWIPFGSKKAQFHYFKLKRNEEGIPGDPHRYWAAYKNKTSLYEHCDVHKALKHEGL
ncbi:exported hypothetical protein [Candidatus Terasakiella magnetica]|uniref:Uncharacterized protein n=1 Tax=Candidatus Terasakiella magnetica TaxID=1867952 RepID=A0A1C3RDW2_9PROT|nr:hypothetical protein [Candidatus Terasakiella magnetica]SCA55428.1 exported hypothetical protein [Candidatus Terasakiella magnetica]